MRWYVQLGGASICNLRKSLIADCQYASSESKITVDLLLTGGETMVSAAGLFNILEGRAQKFMWQTIRAIRATVMPNHSRDSCNCYAQPSI